MNYGFSGRLLHVDLSSGQIATEELEKETYRKYLGGAALAGYFLLKEIGPRTDPLGPENILVFAGSVLTGTPGPCFNRITVAGKSPLTGGWGESQAGGWFAPELKFAGFDAIIIRGRAENPVYLWVHDGQAEIRDATPFWGLSIGDAQDSIQQDVGDGHVRVALIGPGGERLVRFAGIANNLRHFCGRSGMGAVMGSKNLKAIAVRGTGKVEVYDPQGLREVVQWFKHHYRPEPGGLHDLGTAGGVLALDAMGLLPTRNFTSGSFEGAETISGEKMKDTILVGRGTCWACGVKCKREVEIIQPYHVDSAYGGPEYETLAALGSVCGVDDLAAVAKGNELCGRYGLDTISTGMSIAFAMECYENGLISRRQADGLELRFGRAEAMVEMIRRIGERQGLGDLLAEGPARAAQQIGGAAERFALHVKGQPLPMHEPRGKQGLALGYATSPSGADHLEAPHDEDLEQPNQFFESLAPLGLLAPVPALDLGPRKVRVFVYTQQLWNLCNNLGLCIFVAPPYGVYTISKLVEYTRAVTGWDTSLFELLKTGERMSALARVFNARQGFTREDDKLPERLFEPLKGGALAGASIDRKRFEEALSTYYGMMGWDRETGVPTRSKLEELDLGWAADLIDPL